MGPGSRWSTDRPSAPRKSGIWSPSWGKAAGPSASLLDALRWILDTFEFVAEAQISGFRQSRFPEGGG